MKTGASVSRARAAAAPLVFSLSVGLVACVAFAQGSAAPSTATPGSAHAKVPAPASGSNSQPVRSTGVAEGDIPPAIPLSVPPKLAARFRALETSGLAWAEALDRYLVVIDETDEQGGQERAPVVLTLTRDGRFDEAPVRIEGVAEIDDAEAITAAGDNRFYLLTSHSATRSGNLRPARRQLIELVATAGPAGPRLRASRRLDLLDGPGGLGPFLRALDVDLSRGLDAEGIAFHAGALFVGLKEPLGGAKEALIVRIAEPEKAFARGRVPKRALSLWARLSLNVPGGGTTGATPQGIADLVFAGSPLSLFVASNAPKSVTDDSGGALWSWIQDDGPTTTARPPAPAPAGAPVAPRLLAHFRGLHPEGVAVAPDGKTLVVLFDPGTGRPSWTSFPLSPPPARP